jgi:hypothetical protein
MEDTSPNSYLSNSSYKKKLNNNFNFDEEEEELLDIINSLSNDYEELSVLFGNIVSSKKISNSCKSTNKKINMKGRVLIENSFIKRILN